MWTGHLTEEEMLHEHPLELADIKAGVAGRVPPTPEIRRRRQVYYPIAAVVAAVLLFAVYGFVTGRRDSHHNGAALTCHRAGVCPANSNSFAADADAAAIANPGPNLGGDIRDGEP